MKLATDEAEVISRILGWAGTQDRIRAVLLTSTRASGRAPIDILSDYDVILVVSDTRPYAKSAEWTHGFGKPLHTVRDSERLFGQRQFNCMVLYDDGTKIDYSIWPTGLVERMRVRGRLTDELDLGYRVLLDKDNLMRDLPPSTYTAHIPTKPSPQEFQALVEEFWFCATYVAKYLWRNEFVPVKVILDHEIKHLILGRLLQWRIEIDNDWSVKPGFFGRGLEKYGLSRICRGQGHI
jgi:aminoglycoside 6-adenylyltransferase